MRRGSHAAAKNVSICVHCVVWTYKTKKFEFSHVYDKENVSKDEEKKRKENVTDSWTKRFFCLICNFS